MKVKDLIKKLGDVDQDAEVVVTTSNFEQGNSKIPASYVHTYKGEVVSERFRDAFDNETYNTDVIRRRDNGSKNFVEIT